jgi:hypothetical protein
MTRRPGPRLSPCLWNGWENTAEPEPKPKPENGNSASSGRSLQDLKSCAWCHSSRLVDRRLHPSQPILKQNHFPNLSRGMQEPYIESVLTAEPTFFQNLPRRPLFNSPSSTTVRGWIPTTRSLRGCLQGCLPVDQPHSPRRARFKSLQVF